MATSPQLVPGAEGARAKRKRSPSVAKPAFFVIEVLGEDGQPMDINRKRIKLLAVERDLYKAVMMCEEDGEHPRAVWLQGIVPVARQSVPRPTPPTAA